MSGHKCYGERKGLVTTHQFCPDRPYLELRVPDNADIVTFVECAFVGRDQGWYDSDTGPSYTWADVAVQRPPGRNRLGTFNINTNDRGILEFREHKRRWSLQSTKVQRLWGDLQAGDVIQVVPRANFPGWVNLVREARIAIGYEPVQSPSSSLLKDQTTDNVSPTLPILYDGRLDSKNGEIRLLFVQPSKSADQPIVCSLETSRLGTGPDFVALSYCWGRASFKDRVIINGQELEFSSSVVAALRRLRLPEQTLAIWIDQICMNQSDGIERGQQVAIMSRIYSGATQVHVWLGEGDIVTRTAIRIIRDIYNMTYNVCPGGKRCQCEGSPHLPTIYAPGRRHNCDPGSKDMFEVFFAHVRNKHGELAAAAGGVNNLQLPTFMSTLFLNPWFQRIWVLQEALLARSAVVHCGSEMVTWAEVLQVSRWIGTIHQPAYHAPYTIMPDVWRRLQTRDGELQRLRVLNVFLQGLSMNATDPRDKLFALLSFGQETGPGRELPEAIRPSYEKRADQVFADFTFWWIREHESLSILSTIHGQAARTWQRLSYSRESPDVVRPTWSVGSEGQAKWARATIDSKFNFHASSGTVPDRQLLGELPSKSDLSLRLRGFEVARIRGIFHLSLEHFKPQLGDQEKELLHVFDTLFDLGGHHRAWGSSSRFVGFGWKPKPPPEDLRDFTEHIQDHWQSHRTHEEQQPRRVLGLQTDASGKLVADQHSEEEETRLPSCLDPVLFEAGNGLVGLCPWTSNEGDVIVVLHGAKVPYLLRPVEDKASSDSARAFELVGECYAMGIMDGTWFTDKTRSGVVPQVFTLV